MRPMKKILLLLECMLLVSSCSEEAVERRGGMTTIELLPRIENLPQVRDAVSGAVFPANGTYGLFVCKHEESPADFVAFATGMNNLRALWSGGTWKYNYEGSTSMFEKFSISGTDAADFYAYAPYATGIKNPRSIPFSVSDKKDLMWAEQNARTDNRNIAPDGTTKQVSLTFHHAMAWVRFQIRMKNQQIGLVLNTITLKKTAQAIDKTRLYTKGTFNAMDGSLLDLTDGSNLGITYNTNLTAVYSANSDKYDACDMLLVPVDDIDDEGLEVVFNVNGVNLSGSLKIKREDTRIKDTNLYGFRAGYRYIFKVVLDNYARLEGVVIDKEWKPEEIVNVEI